MKKAILVFILFLSVSPYAIADYMVCHDESSSVTNRLDMDNPVSNAFVAMSQDFGVFCNDATWIEYNWAGMNFMQWNNDREMDYRVEAKSGQGLVESIERTAGIDEYLSKEIGE